MEAIPTRITNTDDYLDSRDIEERMVWLEANAGKLDEEDKRKGEQELKTLLALKREYIETFNEESWELGAQFIRDFYFEDYAQELAEDIGAIKDDAQWPCNCIDWERAALELQQDYYQIDFDGLDYWTREA